ncbi:hypothetical protein ACQP25_18515 [Microtetraspora malaysiensis]|uniref:hypothetical protein n=1 Tax=Microtetraspora malaysiensis TaxID=161358 RepID=UPI003D94A509
MIRLSFVLPPEIRQLRDLTRYRVDLVVVHTAERQRVEKLLEDTAHPARRATLTAPVGSVSVAVTPDRRTAITGSADGTAAVWDLTEVVEIAARPLNATCGILDRELSAEEWSLYARGVDHLKICGT